MQTFFLNPRAAFRTSEVGGLLAVLAFPVSISLSQAGVFLAMLGWLWFGALSASRTTVEGTWRMPLRFPLELRVGLAIYAVLALSLLVNLWSPGELSAFERLRRGFRAELKDVFLMSMAFWVLAYADNEDGRRRLYRALHIAAWIIVVAGVVAAFSKFRLAKFPYHIVHGWVPTPTARFQHHATTILGSSGHAIHLYMPIGFMGTHLTYAMHLAFVFPFLLLRVLNPFVVSPGALLRWATGRRVLVLILAVFVLLLNNGRSAILGLVSVLALVLYYFTRTYWNAYLRRLLLMAGAGAVLVGALVVGSPAVNERFGRLVSAVLGAGKHTDWQRIFVWQGTMDIVARHPVFGVGAGAYPAAIEETILRLSVEKPRLWYAYSLTQRGHAHNDPLHLLAVGGPAAAALFLLMVFLLVRRALARARSQEDEYWKWGALAIFAAGLYQCYFQDGEVLLPFWLFVGVLLSTETETSDASSQSVPKPLTQRSNK